MWSPARVLPAWQRLEPSWSTPPRCSCEHLPTPASTTDVRQRFRVQSCRAPKRCRLVPWRSGYRLWLTWWHAPRIHGCRDARGASQTRWIQKKQQLPLPVRWQTGPTWKQLRSISPLWTSCFVTSAESGDARARKSRGKVPKSKPSDRRRPSESVDLAGEIHLVCDKSLKIRLGTIFYGAKPP